MRKDPPKTKIIEGMYLHKNSDGYSCLTLNYRAQTEESIDLNVVNEERRRQKLHPIASVPQYFDWLAETMGGKDNPIWQEEMENNPYASTQKLAAYFNFDPDFHTKHYPGYIVGSTVYISIDFGFHHPCAIIAQAEDKQGHTFLHLHHTVRGRDQDLDVFLDAVYQYTQRTFPHSKIKWAMTQEGLQAGGSGITKAGMASPFELMRSKGFVPFYKYHHIGDGVDLINRILGRSVIKGLPLTTINPDDRDLLEMFGGGYRRREVTIDGQPVITSGFIKDNWNDHVSDAVRPLYMFFYKFDGINEKRVKGRKGGVHIPM